MRISDWSSDVCSSDLVLDVLHALSLGAIFQLNPGCAVQIAVGLVWDKAFATSSNFRQARSEEHTSELQSLMRISYAVFCLNKKKRLALFTIKSFYTREIT